ncbi:unnamed protein product [Taenia asiatica]|uniref:BRCT domain-containing protein n=1 Tax=Taenia asiatica TaxID=60517 RepID=A0A0R3W8S4_TAEAS|nr:unnamed protein product [Taenia asiatica]
MNDPSDASGLLEMESGFGDEEWSRRSHEFPTQQTSDSFFACGVENYPDNETKGGRVDWGPRVERLESPHLSVISEASTNESKTRSRKNGDFKKECEEDEEEEEEEGTQKFSFPPLEIATFWNGGNKHDVLTPTPTGLVVKDESQRTKLQEGDSEEENDKTISQAESSEVRTKEDEAAEPLQRIVKSSTDSIGATNAEEEQFQEEIMEPRRELTEDNDIGGLGVEISAVEKRSSQALKEAKNASELESQVPGEDGILERTALLEAENDNFLEPRCEPRIALVQRDTGKVHKQADRRVKVRSDELLPREYVATRKAREKASGEDLDRQSGKVGAMEKIGKRFARNSAKIKKKMKNSQQKKWSEDQLARVTSASEGKTDSRSTGNQEFQVLDNHGKDANRFQSAAKFERGGSTKPNGKNKKYRVLKNGRGGSEFDDLSNVKGRGNNLSGTYVKHTREAHKKVEKEPTSNYLQDKLFHSIFAGVVEDGFNSEFIYNGLLEYVPQSDDDAKQETEGVKVAKVMKATKGTGSCLQKKGEGGRTSGSPFGGVYPVDVDEPFAVWNGNQWDPAVPTSEVDRCEMDQQNVGEDLELNNKEAPLTSLHLDGLWEAEDKQAIMNEANSTKGLGKEEAVWDQAVESTAAIQDSSDFTSTLKKCTCHSPEQSVCVASKVDENGSQPEDMSSMKKSKKKKRRCRKERDFDKEAGKKEADPSANREIGEKVQVGNEATSAATELSPCVDDGGLDKKSNNQLDLPDLDEGLPSHPKENSNSVERKSETQGDEVEENGEEKVNLDEVRKPNDLEKTDATEGFLPSEEFETCAREDGMEGVSHELQPQRGKGTLKEYLKGGEESRNHAAEGCDTLDEIEHSSPKASKAHFMESGKRKHRNRRHLMSEGEVEERNSYVVFDSQEVSNIEAKVNLKASEGNAGVGYPLQSEESKGALGFVRDDQEPATEVEKQTSNVLKEVAQPVEHDILINGLTAQPQDEPQINERESEDVGGTLHEVMDFGKANAVEHLHETRSRSSEQDEEEEVEERLQNERNVEGVGVELSPLTKDDVLRGGTKEDAEPHERPTEGRVTLHEIDQFKALQEVADLSCAGEPGEPSMKGGKRKRHRKGRNLASEVKVGDRPGSTVFAPQKAATMEAEVEVKAYVVTADVRYPMQPEKAEDNLEIVDSDQELVSEIEKQSTIVLDKVSQSAEHEFVVNDSAGETEDEPQINECELKVQGDSVNALRTSGKVSDVEHLHEPKAHSLKHEDRGEEVGRLQNVGYAEGADGDLQPQINKGLLREYAREDTESQEDPAEDRKRLNEIDQSEATPSVVALPSLKVPEATSAKGGKRNKTHRKARHLPIEAETQRLDSSTPPEKVVTGISDEVEFHPSKTVVDEQETALDLLKETSQPLQHENLLKDSLEHLEDWPRISNHKLAVRDVEGISDEPQPQTNEEALKNSTVEIVESEGNQIFSVLSESEVVPVRSESKKRHRKGKHTRGEGEIKTPKTNADAGYSVEPKEDAKAKDTATGDVALVSDALGEISQPNKQELMEEETAGHLDYETQSNNCKLEGQAMIVDDSKPHSAEEDAKKWDHEESECRLLEGVEDGSEPQKTRDISRECTDEGDVESYKHSTEGGRNVNEVVESEANQDVDVSSSSHEPEAPLVKRIEKKKHRKRKQLLHETEVVASVELPLQPKKDGTALDVATDDRRTVPGIDKHSTVALEEVAVKGSFSYLRDGSQINECELEAHRDFVHELKDIGDANRTGHQKHREEEECGHRSDESEFEGAGDEILKEVAGECEESYEYPTNVEDNGDDIVGAEARQTTDALSSSQEPEEISIKTEERNHHEEDGCLHDEADAQDLQVSTDSLPKEVLSMNNEDETKPARTSADEHECVFGPLKEIPLPKEHEAMMNESFGPVNSELQTNECSLEVQGESVLESRSPVKAGGPKPKTKKQCEEEQLQDESDNEGVRDESQFQKSNDVVSGDMKEPSEHKVCSAEGRDILVEFDQPEAVRRADDLPSVEEFEALSMKGRKKKKQKKRRPIMGEIEVDDSPASTVLASPEFCRMEADADPKTSEKSADMGCPTQPEDYNESVPEIGKRFTVVLDEVSQPVEHEFVVNKLTDQPEDEPQTNECESEAVGETHNEFMGFGKTNVVEQLHEIRSRLSEQDEGVEEHSQDESDVGGRDVEMAPAESNDVMKGGTEGDAEPQEHPTESGVTLAEIGRSETPQKVVDSLSAEEPEVPFIKGGKKKKHRKGRYLTGEAMVEDRLASTVPDSQEAEVVLRSPEVTADVGLPMQPEEVKDTLGIVDDEQELVPEFEKQPTIVLSEVSQSLGHEFLLNESSDQPEDELQINECESEVAGEALDERTGFGKGNVGEHLHANRAQSSEREEGVEEHLQDVSGAEGVDVDLLPQTNEDVFREGIKEHAQPEEIPAKGNDILDKLDQPETAHGSVGLPSLEIPEVPPIKDGKKKKQRKRRHIMGEAEVGDRPTSAVLAVDDQESVSEIEKQANNAIEEASQPTPRGFVVNDLTDHLDDWFTTKECDTEVQGASADEFGTIGKANTVISSYETEARSSEYENAGKEERMQDKVDVEGVSNESQRQTSKDSLEAYRKADSESQEHPAEGHVTPDEIDQPEALQKIVDMSSAEEVEALSMKGRKKKHRKGRNLRGKAEVDAADFKTSEEATGVRCPMQPEEDQSPPNVAVDDEQSVSSALEEISQSTKQELMEKELPSHLEGGTQSVPFELEIPGVTDDESRTIFQSNDLVPFRETDKQLDKQNKNLSLCGAEGKFWSDGLCFEGVANATQPQTDEEDLDGSTEETVGSQEHSKEGENTVDESVQCEAIPSDGSLSSLRKLESPSTNRVKTAEIEKEQYQRGNSVSLLEEQLSRSSFDGVNAFRDVMPQGEPSSELSEVGEIWVTGEVDSTFKNRPPSDESVSSYPKYKNSLELENTGSLRNPTLEYDGHLSIPQVRLDVQKEFGLTESIESRGSSKEHVESGFEASQARLAVEEVPSNQEIEKSGRVESSNDYSGDEKLPSLWIPTLLPSSKARETVEGEEPELSSGSNGQFTLHASDLEKLTGERSQISDFATSDDSAVTPESTHSPDVSSSPKVDDTLPLSRDSSPNLDGDLFQADSTMEMGEDVAVTESKSIQEQVSLSPDISKSPSQESKENSKKQGKKKKQQKEKTLECRGPIQVVDTGTDERRSSEQQKETMLLPSPEGSDAGSTKTENKKKKHQRKKCAKNANMTEENSKFLSSGEEAEKYPIDKEVREAECVQITSTSLTSKEASESFSEQVCESNVQGVSSDFEGPSPVIMMEMEFQKESIAESDAERTTGDGRKSDQEANNLECNSEQIESWKEAERLKCPAATTQENVDPNRTVNLQIHGNIEESTHRAKEFEENAEAQRKDEEEPGVNEFPKFVCQEDIDVDGDKGEHDQLSKEADTLVDNIEGKDGINSEESHGIEEMGPCQTVQEFGRNPTGMNPMGPADEHFRSDEKEVINFVEGVSDKDMESTSHPSKGVDESEASLDHFVSPKPPSSEVQRNESHQGTWYTILDDPIPAAVDLENENLQKTESFKVSRKDDAEKESSESSPPHLNKATDDGNSAVVAEEEGRMGEKSPSHDEHLGQTGSVHETEVFKSDLISTDLPFPQELDGEVAEFDRSKKKHWKKGSTMNETVECLTPAVEVDKPHESVELVDETNIPTNAIESKVVHTDDDLPKKDIPQQEVEKSKNVECSLRVDIQDVGSTSREPDNVGKVQGAITDVKIEEAFSSKSGKKRRKKEKTEKAEYPSAISLPAMSHLSKSRQQRPVNLQEVEKGDRDVATDSQQSLNVEAPVEDVQPDITSTPREGDIPSSGSLTETTQPPDVVTSLHPPSPLKADVKKEPCVVADVEIGRQIESMLENVHAEYCITPTLCTSNNEEYINVFWQIESVEVDEEEADEGAVTSTDHSFTFLEQSPSDTDEVDDFTVVVKAPPPRTIIEAEASQLQIRVKPKRWRWPGSFLILLLFLLFFLIPIIILFCIAAPDFCFLPGACPGLTLRQRINAYIVDYHRQRMSPFPT